MPESIVNGIFILASAVITGAITLISTRSGSQTTKLQGDNVRLKKRLEKALRQIEAYHLLEDIYASSLVHYDQKKSAKTIKIEHRNMVVEQHQCERPLMTAKEAAKEIRNME